MSKHSFKNNTHLKSHTFENFFEYSGNSNAINAAKNFASITSNATVFSIHGQCGNGKSHLIFAMLNTFLQNNPEYEINFISAESLLNVITNPSKNTAIIEQIANSDVLAIEHIAWFWNNRESQAQLLKIVRRIIGNQGRILIESNERHRPENFLTEINEIISNASNAEIQAPLAGEFFDFKGYFLDNFSNSLESTHTMPFSTPMPANIRSVQGEAFRYYNSRNLIR